MSGYKSPIWSLANKSALQQEQDLKSISISHSSSGVEDLNNLIKTRGNSSLCSIFTRLVRCCTSILFCLGVSCTDLQCLFYILGGFQAFWFQTNFPASSRESVCTTIWLFEWLLRFVSSWGSLRSAVKREIRPRASQQESSRGPTTSEHLWPVGCDWQLLSPATKKKNASELEELYEMNGRLSAD